MKLSGTSPAPKGMIWVCVACGKKSSTRYGFDANEHNVADYGWDESCILHAKLYRIADLVLRKDHVVNIRGEAVEVEE